MDAAAAWKAGMDEVVREAREGRSDAFEALVLRHGDGMYRLARAIVGPDDALDVAQEAFVAAWRELPRLRRPDRFEPWLRRIVVNCARNALRTRRRRPAQPLGGVEYGAPEASPLDFREAVHTRDYLDAAFSGLSADHRAAVILHYGADLSIRETADAMGVAVGTAKSRLHTALNHLRAALEVDR